jgi:hypothetical protein
VQEEEVVVVVPYRFVAVELDPWFEGLEEPEGVLRFLGIELGGAVG